MLTFTEISEIMKRILLLFALCSLASTPVRSQPGYDLYQVVDGVEFSTKWGKAKNEAGEKVPALLMKIENTNSEAVTFGFDINLYHEGLLRENGRIEGECLEGLKSSVGKLNGLYFIPENFSSEQIKSSDFGFSLESIEVEKTDGCK